MKKSWELNCFNNLSDKNNSGIQEPFIKHTVYKLSNSFIILLYWVFDVK